MLSKLTESKIAQLFYITGTREHEIERSRETLCQNLDFELYTAFRHLDSEARGSISSFDIYSFLTRHRVSYELSTIQQVISHYDVNLDGRLSLNEFSGLVLPHTNEMIKDSVSLRLPYTGLTLETQYLLLRLLEQELMLIEESEKQRNDITLQRDFSLLNSFRELDRAGNSYLDRTDLRGLFNRNGYYLSEMEVSAVFRRLDSDNDGVINYVEYADAIMPKKIRQSPAKRSPSMVTADYIGNRVEPPLKRQNSGRSPSPPRNSSPLRQPSGPKQQFNASPAKVSQVLSTPSQRMQYRQESPNRNASPLRMSPAKTAVSFANPLRSGGDNRPTPGRESPARVLNCNNLTPYKNSPLRGSPQRTLTAQESPSRNIRNAVRESPGYIRNEVALISGSPLKSMPLRNPQMREAAIRGSPYRGSPIKTSY